MKKALFLVLIAFLSVRSANADSSDSMDVTPAVASAGYGLGIIGYAFGIPLVTTGGVLVGKGWGNPSEVTTGVVSILLGALLLDDRGGSPSASFQALDETSGVQFGMTPDEVAAFNDELPEINAINESLQASASGMISSGASINDVRQAAEAGWNRDKQALSAQAAAAADKVFDKIFDNIQTQ